MLDKTFENIKIYQKALSASWLRNETIANNIANVNTPGYKRQDVKFESILKDYIESNNTTLKRTHPKHLPTINTIDSIEPKITREVNTSFRKDKNNVDIDVEMAELAKNTIRFNILSQQLTKRLHRLKMVISEGRK